MRYNMNHHDIKQQGMMLIEILLAMLISVQLLASIIFLSAKFFSWQASQHQLSLTSEQFRHLYHIFNIASQHAKATPCITSSFSAVDQHGSRKPKEPVILQVFPEHKIPADLHSRLHARSDVLLIHGCKLYKGKMQPMSTAYYLHAVSSQHQDIYARDDLCPVALYEKSWQTTGLQHVLPSVVLLDDISQLKFGLCIKEKKKNMHRQDFDRSKGAHSRMEINCHIDHISKDQLNDALLQVHATLRQPAAHHENSPAHDRRITMAF